MSLISVQDNDIVEILREIVSELEFKICVNNSIDVSPENSTEKIFKIETCNTHYLKVCSIFSINDVEYEVVDFELNKSITYKAFPDPSQTAEILDCFDLQPLKYLVGTPRLTQIELKKLGSDISRLPFVWLLEVFSSNFEDEDSLKPFVCTTPVSLFFFNNSNRDSLNRDQREQVVNPMKGVLDTFLEGCTQSKRLDKFSGVSVIDRVNYGVYQANKGNVSSILGEDLSGVEIRIEFPIFASDKCGQKNNCI